MKRCRLLILIAAAAASLTGCYTAPPWQRDPIDSSPGARVDFGDPVLNHRQIFLFGDIDQRAAEVTIQKLLFLDGKSHEPIELYLQTPGGEFKHAMAIEQTIRTLQSPVNTCAMSECNSGGVVLLAAGTGKRRAFHGSIIVVHGLKTYGRPPPGMKEHVQETYTDFWRRRTKLPAAWLPLPPDVLHVLTAEQALDYGIVDEVVGK